MKLERREFFTKLEVRSGDGEEGQTRTIAGMAAPYGQSAAYGSWFSEEIEKGAFSESILSRNVYGLVGHDDQKPVASTKAGSMRFEERDDGLYLEMEPAETTIGNDLLENVRAGLIQHLSVGFRILNNRWEVKDGLDHHIVEKAELWEVSAVVWPFYEQTTLAEKRSQGAFQTHLMHKKKLEHKREAYKQTIELQSKNLL